MKVFSHFKTICYHKYLVMKGCFAVGLYYQGLIHDLSKFSHSEFFVGAKYYQGTRSPNNKERELYGYSSAWLHHKGRNRHHYEYWTDYSSRSELGIVFVEMPKRYVVEMVMDRIAASKVYNKGTYQDGDPLRYYQSGKGRTLMHEETKKLLEEILQLLANKGEKETFAYLRHLLKEDKKEKKEITN